MSERTAHDRPFSSPRASDHRKRRARHAPAVAFVMPSHHHARAHATANAAFMSATRRRSRAIIIRFTT
ncbi:hypothetical protein, partial [Burkholderia cepacia]|uniref:hypothetical protein n=1 Tax=Burkholderia cepacia TaxID=292 RepID=UPI001E60E497